MNIVVLISANAEWRTVKMLFPQVQIRNSEMGEWFTREIDFQPVLFFHGGAA